MLTQSATGRRIGRGEVWPKRDSPVEKRVRSRKSGRATLKDVAEAVGVNVSTASRALDPTSPHRVSAVLAEKIRRAAKKLGYRPNAAAYSLKTNKTRTIGVVIPDISDPVFPPIIRGIEDELRLHDYISIVANTDNDVGREEQVLATLNARGVDALILATTKRRDESLARLANGCPVVTIIRKADDKKFSSVVHDEDAGIQRLLQHLVSLGHRHIANIAGPQDVSTGYNRLKSVKRYHKALLPDCEMPTVIARAFSEEEGERCAQELLASGRRFTAVTCANDQLAIGAIAAFARGGRACPGDISVTGFNDIPLADRLLPSLTTIRVQHHKLGVEAALLAVERLKEAGKHPFVRHVVLPIDLVVRESTKALRRHSA
jgi:LacI family transcriptional regulator